MADLPAMFDLSGRVLVLTGGAGLLGRKYAFAMAEAGAHIVIADVNGRDATDLACRVSDSSGIEAIGTETDVSQKPSVISMVEETLEKFGRLDILVNNAAIDAKFDPEHSGSHTQSFEEFPVEVWERSVSVNVTGMLLCSQVAAVPMLKQGHGIIVNISSIYGIVAPDQRIYAGLGEGSAYKPVDYPVTKSAVLGLTRYLAAYWAGKNIRVNSMTLGGVYNGHDEEFVRRYSYRTPLGRMAEKEDFCGPLLFLVADASAYMTGANLVIDGGWSIW